MVGGIERELTVELRPQALQAAGVSVAQVVGALQAQNLSAPVGRLLGNLDERTIRLRGRLAAPADFERLVVSESKGRLVRLGDVAVVRDGTEEPRSAAMFDGAEAVGIEIVKAKGYSTTAVAQAIRDEVGPAAGRRFRQARRCASCATPACAWRSRSATFSTRSSKAPC